MTSTELLASVFAVYVAAVVIPGPNTLIVTRLALSGSRRAAYGAVLGIATGASEALPTSPTA